MDDLDRDLLRFAATHRVVSSDQLAVLAGAENHDERAARTGRLVGEGLLSPLRLIATGPNCLVITEAGLAAIGSRLSVPAWEMRGPRQALAAGWVSVRAQDGRFADLTGGVLARRELEAHDSELMSAGPRPSGSAPYGIRVSGVSSAHVSGLHHPDLLLQFRAGWVAVEIVLGAVTPPGLAALLTAYGADDRFTRVVFLIETERVGAEVERAAVNAGVAAVVSVQWMEFA